MTVFVFVFVAFVIYCISSYVTYDQSIRNSNIIFPISVTISVMSTLLWISMIRILNDTNKIIAASFAWDTAVTMAYALIPALLQGKNLSWQSYAALVAIVISLVWFKVSCD
jgi:hypothetical protein